MVSLSHLERKLCGYGVDFHLNFLLSHGWRQTKYLCFVGKVIPSSVFHLAFLPTLSTPTYDYCLHLTLLKFSIRFYLNKRLLNSICHLK